MNTHEPQRNWTLRIDADMVLRAMGADPSMIRCRQPRLVSRVEALLTEQNDFLRPCTVMREILVCEERPGHLLLEGGIEIRNATVRERLRGAQVVVAVIGTIGEELEDNHRSDDPLQSLILDGIGTAAIAALSESILEGIRIPARKKGFEATSALFPGMTGWELAEGQAQIFFMVDGASAGVSLNSSFMMTPSKSISFLVGLGPGIATGPSVCESCGAAARCRHTAHLYAS